MAHLRLVADPSPTVVPRIVEEWVELCDELGEATPAPPEVLNAIVTVRGVRKRFGALTADDLRHLAAAAISVGLA